MPDLTPQIRALTDGWLHYPALRSDRARAIFKRLRPRMLKELARAANADEALVALDGFMAGLPAGVQIFSLFESNPSLIELIVDIAGTAPALAQYLSRNSAVLDAVIGGTFFTPWPGEAALIAEITTRLGREADYEKKLDMARRWMKEWHFRIGVHHLRGLIDASEAGGQYADLARAVLCAVWGQVLPEFARKYGPAPGRGAVVIAMGSAGAGLLNAGSDLDLIVVYDAGGVETSTGPRPLSTRSYYARLTQALVTALTAPMAEGRLYEVDMRLRPSGRQGPVATSLASFTAYQQTDAWTWEHLALSRARVITGEPGLAAEVEAFRRQLLRQKAEEPKIRPDVADMRARLAAAKPATGLWDCKNGPGRLQDIELLAQMMALRAGSAARSVSAQIAAGQADKLSQTDRTALLETYRLLWRLHCSARLLSDRPLDLAELGTGGLGFVLRETAEASPDALARRLAAATERAEAAINAEVTAQDGEASDDPD